MLSYVTTYIISSSGELKKKDLYLSHEKVLLHFMMQFIFFLLFNLFNLQSYKMSIYLYTTNKFKHRDMHTSPLYEHIFTNTLVVKEQIINWKII